MNLTNNSDKLLKEIFSHFELGEPELITFLALEQKGTATVKELLKDLDFPRTSIYEYLSRLESAKLIEADKRNSPTLYIPRPISSIKNILEQNLIQLNSHIKLLETLEKAQQSPVDRQSSSHSDKINRKQLIELIDSTEIKEMFIINLNSSSGSEKSVLTQIIRSLKPKKVKIKELVAGNIAIKDFKSHYSNPHLSLQVAKFDSTNKTVKFLFGTCIIWGDLLSEEFVLVKDSNLYNSEKELFNLLWESTYIK